MLARAYPGTTPHYWIDQVETDTRFIDTALDLLGDGEDDQ